METTNGWVQLLAVILGGGVISTIVSAVAQRKKVGSDTEAAFVTTADNQRKGLVADLERVRAERDAEHARANDADWKLRRWWARADVFMIWARRQEARNKELGVVDPMPELYPAQGE